MNDEYSPVRKGDAFIFYAQREQWVQACSLCNGILSVLASCALANEKSTAHSLLSEMAVRLVCAFLCAIDAGSYEEVAGLARHFENGQHIGLIQALCGAL